MAKPTGRHRLLTAGRTAASVPNDPAKIADAICALRVPLDSLTLDPENARHHDARSIEAVAAVLDRHGQVKPIVVQRRGSSLVVRAGNARVEAARLLGWRTIAAVIIDEPDKEATAYALDDNRAAELSEWDAPALARHIVTIDADQLGSLFTPHELAVATSQQWAGPIADPSQIPLYDPASETAHVVVENIHRDDASRIVAILNAIVAADPDLGSASVEYHP